MNIGSLGPVLPASAGAPLAQARGTETDRARQLSDTRTRTTEQAQKAEDAAGIAQTDGEEHETEERDADGRRLWEAPHGDAAASETASPAEADEAPHSKDPTGMSGNQLDLCG